MPVTVRRKPAEVEAVQWTGSNSAELYAFAGSDLFDVHRKGDATALVYDYLHEIWIPVYDGNWIIRGIKGEFYPCDAEVFAEIYELAGEAG
jgi:hypothetical protein